MVADGQKMGRDDCGKSGMTRCVSEVKPWEKTAIIGESDPDSGIPIYNMAYFCPNIGVPG
jgi:hypothetical protein